VALGAALVYWRFVPWPGSCSRPSLGRIGCAFGVEALRWRMSLSMAKCVCVCARREVRKMKCEILHKSGYTLHFQGRASCFVVYSCQYRLYLGPTLSGTHTLSFFLPLARSLARSLASLSLCLSVCLSPFLTLCLLPLFLSCSLSFARSRAGRTLEQQEARASPEGVTGRAPC
jgi:hypothetical protein